MGKGEVSGPETLEMFAKATDEAGKADPNSPAVAYGALLTKKLNSRGKISRDKALLGARLLVPHCKNHRRRLLSFLNSEA